VVQLSVLAMLVGGLAGFSVLAVSAPASATPGPWTPTSLPAPSNLKAATVNVQSVSCVSSGNCGAVGTYNDGSDNKQGLLLTETSGTWATGTEATLPAGASTTSQVALASVSCTSAGNCSAVGNYLDSSNFSQALLLTETSGTWGTGVEGSVPAGANTNPEVQMISVSCTSAGNCSAVGQYFDTSFQQQGLFYTETSGTWGTGVELTFSGVTDPGPALQSVSCGSAGNCSAVGTYQSASGKEALLVNQTSGSWGVGDTAPLPSGGAFSALNSVACTSAGNCSAVGSYTDIGDDINGLLLLTETSGTWGTPPAKTTSVDDVNMVVSCTAAGTCGAVGAGFGDAVAVSESAGTWGTPSNLTLPANFTAFVRSVSCGSAGNCTAVGAVTLESGGDLPLRITETSGTWGTGTETALPANAGVESSTLDQAATFSSVSCPSAGNCSAAGEYVDTSANQQGLLVASASGTWATGTEVLAPSGPPWSVTLNSVSCPAAGSCVGAGFAGPPSSSGGVAALAVESGGTWGFLQAVLPANSDPVPNASLDSISCPSAGNCSAVGTYEDNAGTTQGLLLDETSGTWATGIEASGGSGVFLISVACPSAAHCVAIGEGSGSLLAFTETSGTWAAGTALSLPTGANTSVGPAQLTSVSCGSVGNCSIVGSYPDSPSTQEGMLLNETSGVWAKGIEATMPAGNNASPDVNLTSVSCASAGDCSAVGDYRDSSNSSQGVLLNETSGTWSAGIKASPPAGASTPPRLSLSSVSCPAAGDCSAVGNYVTGTSGPGVLFLTETSGTWAMGTAASLPPVLTGGVNDLVMSCGSVGNCAAVGAPFGDGNHNQGLIFTETSGTWSAGAEPVLPGNASGNNPELLAVSCPSVGSCSAVGSYETGLGYPDQGLIETQPSAATGGSGTLTVAPATIDTASTGNTITFTYTAVGATSDGAIEVAVPAGWSAPSVTATAAGDSTSTCGTVSITGTTIVVSGVTLADGATCTITYGSMAGTGPGATAPSSPGPSMFDASEMSISGGLLTPLATSPSVTISSPGPYSPLPPLRVCDTRPVTSFTPANQCDNGSITPVGAIAAGAVKTINVANGQDGGLGSFGVPADATSVVLNVTAVNTAAPGGFMTVYPAGAPQPNASNLNYSTSETVPNLVQVAVGASGDISFFSSSQTDLVVDLEGYTTPASLGGAGLYNPLASPSRLCDTRADSSFTSTNQCNSGPDAGKTHAANGTINVAVANGGTIPDNATAAVLNVTVTNPTQAGFLTVFPQGGTEPNASNVNYVAGLSTTNRVIVPLSGDGITIDNTAPTDVVVDVSGYFTALAGTGSQFTAEAAPVRICDTRSVSSFSPSNQCSGLPIGLGGTRTINVSGLAGVPASAKAVVVNLTGVDPTQSTFLTVFPQAPVPNSSDLNPSAGENRANMVVATLNPTVGPHKGQISIFNQTGSINVIVDVLGWYS
jgi:hypothetical protein